MITIAIPLGTGTQWEDNFELKYFLRSLDAFLKVDFEVKLYTRRLPSWLKRDAAKYEIVDKYYPDKALRVWDGTPHFESYFDTLHKLELMARDDDVTENFLYCYDDMALLRPVYSFADIKLWYAQVRYLDKKKKYDRRGSKWTQTVMTVKDLIGERFVYDYETHLPRYYNRERLLRMFSDYPVEDQITPYAPATMYGNLFCEPDGIIDEDNPVKAGFYGDARPKVGGSFPSFSAREVEEACQGKLWMNYNNKGFRQGFIGPWLEQQFPNKSIFEK